MYRCFTCFSVVILSSALAGTAAAQSSPNFRGPIAGFIYNQSSRTIRPLLGVPGATRIGSALWSEVDFASVGPDGKWAFLTRDGRSAFVNGLLDSTPAELPADGVIDAVDRVLWNRAGSFALLYSSTTNRLQRVGLSASAVTADPALDLTPWGTAAALAIDPTGRRIAFGIAGSGLYLFEAGQSPALLSSIAKPALAAFDGTGRRIYAVNLDQNQIVEFDSGSSAMTFAALTQPDAPGGNPVGLTLSGDDQYLLLADAGAQAVRVYDTRTRDLVNTLPLDFAPSRFEALSSAPTFLLNSGDGGQWLLVLDASRLPSVSFVPANREEAR